MIPAYQNIDDVSIGYLGSLEADCLIVVVGRSNYKKSSASLDALLKDLNQQGHSVCWFESRNTQTSKILDEEFERLFGFFVRDLCERLPRLGGALRKLTKGFLLLMRPSRWEFWVKCLKNNNQALANDLRTFLRRLPAKNVVLYSHSAGGIVCSLAASEPSVVKLICFGYPFKHPEKSEESSRTQHLAALQKPFLIIQGDEDEYGTAHDIKRYQLSATIKVESICSGHDYDGLDSVEYQRCFDLLQRFVT